MAKIKSLTNRDGEVFYPLTHTDAVLDKQGKSVSTRFSEMEQSTNEKLSELGEEVRNDISRINQAISRKEEIKTYEEGYINSEGRVTSSSYATHSDFLPLRNNKYYVVRTRLSQSWYAAYYSEANEESFISSQKYSDTQVNSLADLILNVPNDAKFVRVTVSKVSGSAFLECELYSIEDLNNNVLTMANQVEEVSLKSSEYSIAVSSELPILLQDNGTVKIKKDVPFSIRNLTTGAIYNYTALTDEEYNLVEKSWLCYDTTTNTITQKTPNEKQKGDIVLLSYYSRMGKYNGGVLFAVLSLYNVRDNLYREVAYLQKSVSGLQSDKADKKAINNQIGKLDSEVKNIKLALSKDCEDVSTSYEAGYINSSGGVIDSKYANHSAFVQVERDKIYIVKSSLSANWYIGYYSEASEDSFISSQQYSTDQVATLEDVILEIPDGANYARVTVSKISGSKFLQTELYKLKDIDKKIDKLKQDISNELNKEVYYVKKDGSGDFTGIHQAFVALADNENKKTIYIEGGEYDILEEMGGQEFLDSIPVDVDRALWPQYSNYVPHNTEIIGLGEVTMNFFPPDNTLSTRMGVICPMAFRGSVTLRDITINSKNSRYALHDETGDESKYKHAVKKFYNVKLYKGRGGYTQAYGAGHSKHSTVYFENCIFSSPEAPWSSHDNVCSDGTTDGYATFVLQNCAFVTEGETAIRFATLSSKVGKYSVQINNCTMNGIIYLDDSETTTNKYALNLIKSGTPDIICDSNNINYEPLIIG